MPRSVTPITETIDGEVYVFQFLNTSVALNICAEVAKRVVPILGNLTGMKAGLDTELGDIDFGQVASSVALAVEPEVLQRLVSQLCSVAFCQGGSQNFEEHYRGRPGHALKVAKKSFEVNCGDFFASAASLAGIQPGATTQGK